MRRRGLRRFVRVAEERSQQLAGHVGGQGPRHRRLVRLERLDVHPDRRLQVLVVELAERRQVGDDATEADGPVVRRATPSLHEDWPNTQNREYQRRHHPDGP